MTGTWNTLPRHRKDLAVQAFVALDRIDGIADAAGADEKAGRRIGFGDLYAYVNDPVRPMSPALRAALQADVRLREDLLRLLANTAGYRGPRAAAASTQVLETRQGQGFTMRLRPSRAEPTQVFVVIELLDISAEAPKALFIAEPGEDLLKHPLPEARGGTMQLLAESESDLVRALRNPTSEVYLR